MAFDPVNVERDLLVIMLEAYAATLGRSLDSITRWIEKTPANRRCLPAIHSRFPHARILVTMRDPRAIFAAQIALEKTRQLGTFSTYYCISHWRQVAKIVLRAREERDTALFLVPYEKLILDPGEWMKRVCAFLAIEYDPAIVLTPTKAGKFWEGNSATETAFFRISTEPLTRWQSDLSEEEIGWVEWHCRDLMPEFGYEPRLGERSWRHFMKPSRYERPRQYLKSRFYSLRDNWVRRSAE
jgi:hypothetical protein